MRCRCSRRFHSPRIGAANELQVPDMSEQSLLSVTIVSLGGEILLEKAYDSLQTRVQDVILDAQEEAAVMICSLTSSSGDVLASDQLLADAGIEHGGFLLAAVGLTRRVEEQLKSSDRACRFRCLEQLATSGNAATMAFAIALSDEDWELRWFAAKALSERAMFLASSGRVVPPAIAHALVDSVGSPETWVRDIAMKALGEIGEAAAPGAAAVGTHLDDPVDTVRLAAVRSLCGMGASASRELAVALQSNDVRVQKIAGDRLVELNMQADELVDAIPALMLALPSFYAECLLTRVGLPALSALKEFAADQHEDDEVRAVASAIIGAIESI
eukprot:TRINITY_DN22713_c0_g1_i1.p1 TRINITY_DN22713_c0_g1~~TRINITY_DN22713_c0_g1_i1.p1  ORF type:complete len:330 (-),score=58.58 TRINITY_DN22713_c0_g1_i1:179-1168(-)